MYPLVVLVIFPAILANGNAALVVALEAAFRALADEAFHFPKLILSLAWILGLGLFHAKGTPFCMALAQVDPVFVVLTWWWGWHLRWWGQVVIRLEHWQAGRLGMS